MSILNLLKERVIMKWTLIIGLMLVCMQVNAAKKHCKSYLDKLNTIKAQQRSGYSLSKGKSLAEREKKARKKWWDCETGKLKPRKKAKKKSKTTKNKTRYKPPIAKIVSKKNKKRGQSTGDQKSSVTPFASDRAITINSRYHGKQQQAWLSYYRPKAACLRPKSTQAFARCVEDKTKQQQIFEQEYQQTNLTK
jgi:hypothetical protein